LIGLGKPGRISDARGVFRSFCFKFQSKLPLKVGIELRHFPDSQVPAMTDAAVNGMHLGLYNVGLLKSQPADLQKFGGEKSELDILAPVTLKLATEAAVRRGEAFAKAGAAIMNMVNLPGNYKNPSQLSAMMVKAAKTYGFTARVLDEAALKKEKLDALLAVGQGSPHPAQLVWLEYQGKAKKKGKMPVVGLVGKGVTFDTGGISLKPSTNMHFMKSDMGGGAAVIGTFIAAAQLGLPIRLVGAIPIAENTTDGTAVKPGDVIGSHAGKTIEVTDTDAEGRLILADALSYLIQHEKTDVLIDLATLTGSVIRALGYFAAGLFTASDDLSRALLKAGQSSGERLWPFPMWDEYGSDLKSDVADLRNFTGKPMAECISAAKFLENFTGGHPAWAHLDIAGTAFGDSEFAQGKTATGFGVRLLVEFLEGM
jgi:leucyl aminopeptidase